MTNLINLMESGISIVLIGILIYGLVKYLSNTKALIILFFAVCLVAAIVQNPSYLNTIGKGIFDTLIGG
jgi:hypothetical protein